jgi:hypothetical protein
LHGRRKEAKRKGKSTDKAENRTYPTEEGEAGSVRVEHCIPSQGERKGHDAVGTIEDEEQQIIGCITPMYDERGNDEHQALENQQQRTGC